MDRIFLAPFAPFFKLDFALDELLVLSGPVIDAFAVFAGKFDELYLFHMFILCRSSIS